MKNFFLRFKYSILFAVILLSQTHVFAQPPIGNGTVNTINLNGLPFTGTLKTPCYNSGFEVGSFSNWGTFVGSVSSSGGVNLSTFSSTIDFSQHKIINSTTTDPFGNFLTGECGNKSAQIGDLVGGNKSSMIKYTFTVNSTNVNFSFRYAMVLQDPSSHSPNEKPFFQYMVLKGNRSYFSNLSQIISSKKFTADGNNPFYNNLGNGIIYKDWSTECINLSNYIGQEVSILFFVADCALGGHGAYAYIDCLCENNDAIAKMTLL